MTAYLILLGILIVILYIWYIKIITKRNHVYEALSGIDVQLKQRSSLIPNILTMAKKYLEHETALFTEVTRLREHLASDYDKTISTQVSEHLAVANELAGKMAQLKLSLESYPNLKSNETMVKAMQTYNEVESNLAAARRFYNSSVAELNNSVQIFPGSLIAKAVKVSPMPFFEADEKAKSEIKAADYI